MTPRSLRPPSYRTASGSGGGAMVTFWVSSLSVGLAAFVILAVIARTADAGGLADASAVLSVSFVLAVVPGAIQLRAAATAAGPSGHLAAAPQWIWWAAGALLVAAPAVASGLTVPALSLALLAAQLPVASIAAAQRGGALGRSELSRASASMLTEAAVRMVAGVALGAVLGAVGLAAGLLLGSAAAAALGRGWAQAGESHAMDARAVLGPALTLGALMLLANLDTLAAPRLLGPGADEYAIAALPAKGVFFALFAASWTAVPVAARSRTARELLAPAAVVAALAAGATALIAVTRPVIVAVLGDPEPSLALLVTLAAASGVAATLATVLAMTVARGARGAWLPVVLGAVGLAAVLAVTGPDALALGRLAALAQLAVLACATVLLLRTPAPAGGTAVVTAPQGAP